MLSKPCRAILSKGEPIQPLIPVMKKWAYVQSMIRFNGVPRTKAYTILADHQTATLRAAIRDAIHTVSLTHYMEFS